MTQVPVLHPTSPRLGVTFLTEGPQTQTQNINTPNTSDDVAKLHRPAFHVCVTLAHTGTATGCVSLVTTRCARQMGVDSCTLSSSVAALHATLRAVDKAVRTRTSSSSSPAEQHSTAALSPQSAAAWRLTSAAANETARTALQAAAGERASSAALEQRLQAAEARNVAVTQQRDNALRALEDAAAAVVVAQTERSKAEALAESLQRDFQSVLAQAELSKAEAMTESLGPEAAPRKSERPTATASCQVQLLDSTADERHTGEVAALQQEVEAERVRTARLDKLLRAALAELADLREAEASMQQLRSQAGALVPAAAEAVERWTAARQPAIGDAPQWGSMPQLPAFRDDAPAARTSPALDVASETGHGVDPPSPASDVASPQRPAKAAVSQSPLRSLSKRHPLAI